MKRNAFSLLELLIALLIFSVIGLATEGLISSSIKTQTNVVSKTEQLENIAEIALRMRSDFLQVINRSVVSYEGEREAAFVGGSAALSFTRSAWDNPLETKRSNYQRVIYLMSKNSVERQHTVRLDAVDEEDLLTREFKGIKDLSFQYLNASMEWVLSWNSLTEGHLPRAVKVSFSTEGFMEVVRVFEIPSLEIEEEEDDSST